MAQKRPHAMGTAFTEMELHRLWWG